MSDKITIDELQALFGSEIPMQAFQILAAPGSLSVDNVRASLRAIKAALDEPSATTMLDRSKDEWRQYVARMLGFDPDAPDTWPSGVVDDILRKAERAALDVISEEVTRRFQD